MVLKESGLALFLRGPNPEDSEPSIEKTFGVPSDPGFLSSL